ncbi:MAG TPA: hypothetical protein DCY02_03715, partial [Armatimonadetes bacterium]|nr:hypothetical protein [Armatimonadota bacterium]
YNDTAPPDIYPLPLHDALPSDKPAAEKAAADRAAAEREAQAATQRPQSDRGAAYVTAMFRDASAELNDLDEGGWRDADLSDADVYDFGEAA